MYFEAPMPWTAPGSPRTDDHHTEEAFERTLMHWDRCKRNESFHPVRRALARWCSSYATRRYGDSSFTIGPVTMAIDSLALLEERLAQGDTPEMIVKRIRQFFETGKSGPG